MLEGGSLSGLCRGGPTGKGSTQCRAGRTVRGARGDDVGEAHWGRLLQGTIGDLPIATEAGGQSEGLRGLRG